MYKRLVSDPKQETVCPYSRLDGKQHAENRRSRFVSLIVIQFAFAIFPRPPNGSGQNETTCIKRKCNPWGTSLPRHKHRVGRRAAVLCSGGVLRHPRGDSPRKRGRRLFNLGPYQQHRVAHQVDHYLSLTSKQKFRAPIKNVKRATLLH